MVFGKVALKMQIYSGDTVAVQSFIYIVIYRESLLNKIWNDTAIILLWDMMTTIHVLYLIRNCRKYDSLSLGALQIHWYVVYVVELLQDAWCHASGGEFSNRRSLS